MARGDVARGALVDLGRDPRVVQKGLATVLALGVPLSAAQLVLWWQGYPPAELILEPHALQVVLTVPLMLVGLALATIVIQLAVPAEHDRRWDPILGRLGVTSVTMAGPLFIALVTAVILGLGLADPQVWWNESAAVYWSELAFGLWSFALLLLVVRVSTQRRWFVVVPLTVLVLLVSAAPYFPLWMLG